jgi:hypothetical protein
MGASPFEAWRRALEIWMGELPADRADLFPHGRALQQATRALAAVGDEALAAFIGASDELAAALREGRPLRPEVQQEALALARRLRPSPREEPRLSRPQVTPRSATSPISLQIKALKPAGAAELPGASPLALVREIAVARRNTGPLARTLRSFTPPPMALRDRAGALETGGLRAAIRELARTKETGALMIEGKEVLARLYFENGLLIDASAHAIRGSGQLGPAVVGDRAVPLALRVTAGKYDFLADVPAPDARITLPLDALLAATP